MSQYRRTSDPKRAKASARRPFRPFFLLIIVLAVCWGFWNNTERRIDLIVGQSLFSDETQTVSAAQRDELVELLKTFKRDFGVSLEVHVRKKPPPLNAGDTSKLYFDIVPSQGRVYMTLPPLVRHAVGPEFIRDMELSFAQDFAAGDWRISLIPAVLALRNKLAEVTR